MIDEKLQFSTKPNSVRILLPKTLLMLFLGILLYIGIQLNISLLGISVNPLFNYMIIGIIIAAVGVHFFFNKRKISAATYNFYTDRIVRTGRDEAYISYVQASSTSKEQNIFDRLFNTATISIEPDFRIEHINNAQRVLDYIQKMTAYYRNQTMHRDSGSSAQTI